MKEKKFLLNSSQERICVEIYTPQIVDSTIIFCHGVTGCRKGRTMEDGYFQDLADRLMNKNFKVVLFDYSGHGESEGEDYEACLSKGVDELRTVFENEVVDKKNVSFLAFSYGATVLCEFLEQKKEVVPNKIVMYSPCLYPLESCFLNDGSIFGKDIVKANDDGSLGRDGYAIVGAKKFKLGKKMIDECRKFSPDYLKKFSDKMIVFFGKNDVILDTSYNEKYCEDYSIKKLYFDASHSLYEQINEVFDITIDYFCE